MATDHEAPNEPQRLDPANKPKSWLSRRIRTAAAVIGSVLAVAAMVGFTVPPLTLAGPWIPLLPDPSPAQMKQEGLQYHHGPVEHKPRVHLIAWGAVPADYSSNIKRQIDWLSANDPMTTLAQYGDGQGPAATVVTSTSVTEDRSSPPVIVTPGDLEDAVMRAVAANHSDPTIEDQYVVLLPAGVNLDIKALGYHSAVHRGGATYVYSVVTMPAAGVSQYLEANRTTWHEITETIVDPTADGWNHFKLLEFQKPFEVADACEYQGYSYVTAYEQKGSTWVPVLNVSFVSLWDQKSRSCVEDIPAGYRMES